MMTPGKKVFLFTFILFLSNQPLFSQYSAKKYYCTPCSSLCDAKSHDKPGMCDVCEMPLIPLSEDEHAQSVANSGIPRAYEVDYDKWEELGSNKYRASTMWIDNYKRKYVRVKNGDLVLSGALYFPKIEQGQKVPAVIIAHGSGPTTEYNPSYYTYLGLKMGMAVLVCDKRGVGNSEGEYDRSWLNSKAVFNDLASDLVAQLHWLKTVPEIDATKIGMLGPSQAGWIMPIAATMDNSFEFIVSLAGPAVSLGEEGYYSLLTKENSIPAGISIEEAHNQMASFTGDPIYDPASTLEKLTTKTLWQFGAHDRSVPTAESVRRLKALNKPEFDIIVMPNVGHGSANVYTGEFEDFIPIIKPWLEKIGVLKGKEQTEMLLNQVVEDFRMSIIEHNDESKFLNLFLHDSITWSSIYTENSRDLVLERYPDYEFQNGSPRSFYSSLQELDGVEEWFYNVKIDSRNDFAIISFDYTFNIGPRIQNWGTEYWSLMLVNNVWKITSVTWSMNLEEVQKCPFVSDEYFRLKK